MNYQTELDGIRMDIQTVGFDASEGLQQSIGKALQRLKRFYSGDVIAADVYMRNEETHSPSEKSLRIRVGVPGKDAFADDTGTAWEPLLRSVTDKLVKQLEKR